MERKKNAPSHRAFFFLTQNVLPRLPFRYAFLFFTLSGDVPIIKS